MGINKPNKIKSKMFFWVKIHKIQGRNQGNKIIVTTTPFYCQASINILTLNFIQNLPGGQQLPDSPLILQEEDVTFTTLFIESFA